MKYKKAEKRLKRLRKLANGETTAAEGGNRYEGELMASLLMCKCLGFEVDYKDKRFRIRRPR